MEHAQPQKELITKSNICNYPFKEFNFYLLGGHGKALSQDMLNEGLNLNIKIVANRKEKRKK